MPPEKLLQLPFLTREMLSWEHGAELDLEIVVTTSNINTFEISGITKGGPFSFSITPTGNTTRESFIHRIADFPIFLSGHTDDTNETHTSLWVEVYLRVAQTRIFKYASGYIFPQRGLSWPGNSGNGPFNEWGPPEVVTVANPAAGANFDVGPVAGELWRVRAVAFRVVNDANVAARRGHIDIVDSGGVLVMAFWTKQDHSANQTRDYMFAAGNTLGDDLDNNRFWGFIPDPLTLRGGMDLQSNMQNIQVGDQISNIRIFRSTMALES